MSSDNKQTPAPNPMKGVQTPQMPTKEHRDSGNKNIQGGKK